MLQDDVLPGTSTVWEYLTFHARLRLPAALSNGERAARVQAIVDQLSLGKVRATSVPLQVRCPYPCCMMVVGL